MSSKLACETQEQMSDVDKFLGDVATQRDMLKQQVSIHVDTQVGLGAQPLARMLLWAFVSVTVTAVHLD